MGEIRLSHEELIQLLYLLKKFLNKFEYCKYTRNTELRDSIKQVEYVLDLGKEKHE